MIFLKYWKEMTILILLCSTYVLGKLYWKKPTEIQVPVMVEVEKVVEKVVTKTVIQKPDGTIITKDETKDVVKDTNSKVPAHDLPRTMSKYSIGVFMRGLDYRDVLFDVGARLGDLPAFASVGYDVKQRNFLLGVRYEF